jgi:hypothetical protein
VTAGGKPPVAAGCRPPVAAGGRPPVVAESIFLEGKHPGGSLLQDVEGKQRQMAGQ